MLARVKAQQAATTVRFPDEVEAYLAAPKLRAWPAQGAVPLTPAAKENNNKVNPFRATSYNMHVREFATTFRDRR